MNRIATIPFQTALSVGFMRMQERADDLQRQMASGRKVNAWSDLGARAPRSVAAHGAIARLTAQGDAARTVGTTLALYDAHLGHAAGAAQRLRAEIQQAIGLGEAAGLDEAIREAFAAFAGAMNAEEQGRPLFGGSNSAERPLRETVFADLPMHNRAIAFASDSVRREAELLDGERLQYGTAAHEVGSELYDAFRDLAIAGPFNGRLTDTQRSTLAAATEQLAGGIDTLRAAQGANGRQQQRLDRIAARAEEREILYTAIASKAEDANLAEVAGELTRVRSGLEASYAVFSQLSRLSLTQYLR